MGQSQKAWNIRNIR